MSRVLIATDGSDLALAAARHASTMLAKDTTYTILTVIIPPRIIAGPVGGIAAVPDFDESDAQAAVAATAAQLGVTGTQRLEYGDPGPVICKIVSAETFDLVVIGSHGSGVLTRVLLGSVSDYVVHHASCPVLVFHPD